MARRKPGARTLTVEASDPVLEFRSLASMLMATERGSAGEALSNQILAEAGRIGRRSLTDREAVRELRAFVGSMGLGEAADRRLAYLRGVRERNAVLGDGGHHG